MISQTNSAPSVSVCPEQDPVRLWPLTLDELRQQMTRTTFNNWLTGSRILPDGSTDTFWIVVVGSEYAHVWLTRRLSPVIERTASYVADRPVVVCFVPETVTGGSLSVTLLPVGEEAAGL